MTAPLTASIKLDRHVALKVLPEDLASNEDRMSRCVCEAKATVALNHPNIAHIYGTGEARYHHFTGCHLYDRAAFTTRNGDGTVGYIVARAGPKKIA